MKYVLAEFDETTKSLVFGTVTGDPTGYVSDFEPIDVLNGNMIAWDENGNKYAFGPDKRLGTTKITKRVSLVDVGKWNKDEPKLIPVEGNSDELRKLLNSKLRSQENTNHKNISLIDLIEMVEQSK